MPFKALAGLKNSLSAKTLRNVKALLICLRCTEPGYNDEMGKEWGEEIWRETAPPVIPLQSEKYRRRVQNLRSFLGVVDRTAVTYHWGPGFYSLLGGY